MARGYIVIGTGAENKAIHFSQDPQEAADAAANHASKVGARSWAWGAPVPGEDSEDSRRRQNPPLTPERALHLAGLRPLAENEVMGISYMDAWQRIQPILADAVQLGNSPLWGADPSFPVSSRGFLRENYKTAKGAPGVPARVVGLSLLPEFSVFRGKDIAGKPLPFGAGIPGSSPKNTLCAGSSADCRASCLIFTGQNPIFSRNVAIKQALARALVLDPAAFTRMLMESLQKHLSYGGAAIPYVRLNMLSDVPWEVLAPWMFGYFPGKTWVSHITGRAYPNHALFDYTKVPGRNPPLNYHLVFSFSGINMAEVGSEMLRGRNGVFVFVPRNRTWRNTEKFALPTFFHDANLNGGTLYDVIDGDKHDVRARDESSVPGQAAVIGLRWKKSAGRGRAQGIGAFAIRGDITDDGEYFILGESGPDTGANAEDVT